MRYFHLFLMLLFPHLLFAAEGDPFKIRTFCSPNPLVAGQLGRWTVEISTTVNTPIPEPAWQIPSVDGVLIQLLGQNISARMAYGETRTSKSYQFRLLAQKPGKYRIPAFKAVLGKEAYQVPPCELEVLPSSRNVSQENQEPEVYLDVLFERPQLYVGQRVPLRISLSVTPRFLEHLKGIGTPAKEGDAFLTEDFKEPPQSALIQKGKEPLQQVTWATTVIPLKAGVQPIIFKLDALVSVPVQRDEPEDEFSALLSHSLLGSVFREENRKIEISSKPTAIQVLPLPEMGKPQNFSGAIGRFSLLSAQLSETHTKVGEPITLKVVLQGEGNFLRIQAPTLPSDATWKCYPPKTQFQSSDPVQYKGNYTLEYVLIPQKSGSLTVPSTTLSFFDPYTACYTALETPNGLVVEVAENQAAAASAVPQSSPNLAPEETKKIHEAEKVKANPFYLQMRLEHWSPYGEHKQRQIAFWILNAFQACCITLWFFRRRRQLRLLRDPHYARGLELRRSLQKSLKDTREAVSKGNAQQCYEHAHKVIQFSVSLKGDDDPQTLTWHEIETVLLEKGVALEIREALRAIVEAHDHWQYAPAQPSLEKLSEVQRQLEMFLNFWEKL